MMQTVERLIMYSNDDIMQFVNIVVNLVDPDKIILFGSYAYGKPDNKSDIDLLVVKNGKDFSFDDEVVLDTKLFRLRKEHNIGVHYDIFFRTEHQIKEVMHNGGSFVDAMQKGQVVYERAYQ